MGKHWETEIANSRVCSGNRDSGLGWVELGWMPWGLPSTPCLPVDPDPQPPADPSSSAFFLYEALVY